MTQRKELYFLIILIFIAALGCKSEHPAQPLGTWVKTPTKTQSESPGILEFDASYFSFTATQEGHTDSKGRYSILDGKITFEDDTCYNPGTYTYLLEDGQVTFGVIKDSCQARAVVISGSWQRTTSAGE